MPKIVKKSQVVKKSNVSKSNSKIELWLYDEYNSGAIIAQFSDLDQLIKAAKEYVTNTNVENVLTAAEKYKAWDAFYPVFVDKKGKIDQTKIYAGNKKNGKHYYYNNVDGKWVLSELLVSDQKNIRFFLGILENNGKKEDWFLSDIKGNQLSSLNDTNLDGKAVLFAKVL